MNWRQTMRLLGHIGLGGFLLLGALACRTVELPAETTEAPAVAARETVVPLIPANVAPPEVDLIQEVDFGVLRERFGRRLDFPYRCELSPKRRRAGEALVRDDYAETERLTGLLLATCPVDPSLHLWRFAALAYLGRNSEAELHQRWYLGLIESILATGDGRSKTSPFVTISTSEEYAVLSHLGLTPQGQSKLEGPPSLDAIRVRSEAGRESTVYFSPELHFLRLNAIFGPSVVSGKSSE